MRKSAVIIGQAPSRTAGEDYPLSGSSGRRLAELAGIEHEELSQLFTLGNLLPRYPGAESGKGDYFPIKRARERAAGMREVVCEHDFALLLGRNVARAFGFARMPPLTWLLDGRATDLTRWAIFPHPSGVNHFWNDQANVERASAFLRDLVEEVS